MTEALDNSFADWLRSGGKGPRRGLLRRALGGGAALAAAMALPGCAIPVRMPAVPRGQGGTASVLGVHNERFRIENGIGPFEEEARAATLRRAAFLRIARPRELPPLQLLAISGGGENGAFGAGLLCGWTSRGDRPEFDLVTGVSTGALTAPFAFVGSSQDAALRSVYTEVTLADIAVTRGYLAAVTNDAMADSLPLFRTVSRHLDEAMMASIATGYDQGRLLLIGSTDLDAQVPVIWNVGAIARSGHPGALDLIRRILLASAAIPGAFPPAMIDVTVNGERHQEMHVDGGAIAQAFLYPPALTESRRAAISRGERVRAGTIYLIRNARLDPDWALVERRTMGIVGRAVSTMLAASGHNDVFRIWTSAQRDHMDFRLAFIGTDFTTPYDQPFDPTYMRPLFDNGYQRALRGFDWASEPPRINGRPPVPPAVEPVPAVVPAARGR